MSDEIQRVLFIAPKVHVYGVPPLSSNQGYKAAQWNVDNEKARIFTARIRIIETATQSISTGDEENVRTDIRLEDPKTGDLFANCPYEGAHCVEQVIDSSRFFAVRVVDGKRKAVLGIGFEDRSDAFDFGVSLQAVQKQSALVGGTPANGSKPADASPFAEKKDYSLKEGETISITIGNKGRRRAPSNSNDGTGEGGFSMPFLPPPPSAQDMKRKNKTSSPPTTQGFDDDPFGDFV